MQPRRAYQALMVQGTSSNAGKSLLVAALCRIYRKKGLSVCPYKAQNMTQSVHSLPGGGIVSTAQALQAAASGIPADGRMNPVILMPQSDLGSRVFFLGQDQGVMDYRTFTAAKEQAAALCREAYASLAHEHELILLEGAGSPAEINLRQTDIVNMAAAHMADARVLLVGDIDRGGVFAHLYGTFMLLDPDDQERILGFVLNKFRGDIRLLAPALEQISTKTNRPFLGTIPYVPGLCLPEEDSLSQKEHIGSTPGSLISEAASPETWELSLDILAAAVEQAFGEATLLNLLYPV